MLSFASNHTMAFSGEGLADTADNLNASGTPPRIVTIPYAEDVEAMVADIAALRPQVDVLVVSHHWGIHVVPALIADYQFESPGQHRRR